MGVKDWKQISNVNVGLDKIRNTPDFWTNLKPTSNANNLLGRPYSISGKVIKGDQRGRTIGFPTANIKLGNVIRPAFGVYSVLVKDENNNEYKGIANIGRRPTVNDRGELIEVNLFDREINLYDKELEIFLHHFIRAEKKFDNIDKLKKQISKDVKKAKSFLGF